MFPSELEQLEPLELLIRAEFRPSVPTCFDLLRHGEQHVTSIFLIAQPFFPHFSAHEPFVRSQNPDRMKRIPLL